MTTVIFSHGQESGPWGTKIRAMAALVSSIGCVAESVDYRGMDDPGDRVDRLRQVCAATEDSIVLAGSSMGGHVAACAAGEPGVIGLFVLAPAFYMPGYEALTPPPPRVPVEIVHGWHDDVVPPENSYRWASGCAATLHMVDGDHRLTANIDEINYYLARFIKRVVAA